ncbi:MAG: DNA translocase FtsK [Desulfovibrio sp.]|nr:DNA translocase FtsK [Desulfovibrio sp.]
MPSHEEAAHARPLERGAAYSAEPNSGASPAFSGDEENDLPPWVSDFEEGRVGVDRVAPTFQEERDRPLIPFLEHQPEPDPFEDEDLLGLLWGVTKDDPDSGTRTSSDTLEHSKPIVFTEENKLDPSMRTDASDAGPLLSAQTAAAVNILREAAESEPDPELHSGPAAMALPSEDAPAEHARSAQPFSPAAFAPAAVFAPENDTVEKEYDDIPIFEAPAVQAAEPERTGPARTILRRAALPSLDLLRAPQAFGNGMPRAVLEEKGGSLMTCLRDFGIQGELVGITPGPVVTMFEVRPAPGVRVSRIANLSDDLALALKAVAVRIQAPVPGTDTVGVEIPNEVRETVSLKELLGSQVFGQATSLLTLALGKDIAGHPAVADLATMPHLLVAGATGAGKSVGINSIILSLIYKARPEEVKLLLVDPKRVEMAIYADLPHLVHPVVTEMQLAKNALEWAVSEMEERYNAIAKAGVRNIADYNAKIAGFGDSPPEGMEDLVFMPYLVLIIDELADLMLVAAKEVETSIVRLAQLARAAGIHLILATQRPSVDVVTGLIKANFPCRISFQVTSKHDSRTILDSVGAEHLLGKGDMLFKPAGGKFVRMHGAFVSDQEVNAVVSYWKTQQKPDYSIDFAEWNQDGGSAGGGGGNGGDVGDDPMYNEAVDFVRQQGKASISLIQRKFRIGFNKAARYVEQMEMDGVIGPADGSKPRLVIR